jgi:hypothetical protein
VPIQPRNYEEAAPKPPDIRTPATLLCPRFGSKHPDVLKAAGVTDFEQSAYVAGTEPQVDLFGDHV